MSVKPLRYFVGLALVLSLASCTLGLKSCETRYYVVRHAEKLDNTDGSPLTDDGTERAKTLARTLSDKNINRIFVSNRPRTHLTADPTAKLFGLEPIIIPETDTAQLIEQLKQAQDENVLVVRHSQEVPLIVNALSPEDTIGSIDNEFDNLFVVTKRVFLLQTWVHLERLKYGRASGNGLTAP
jgi:phosphohistidine phosphatase SixA